MKIPAMRGIIERRILANFHVDADVLASVLPEPFRPKLIHGVGMAGICLIRLKHLDLVEVLDVVHQDSHLVIEICLGKDTPCIL